MSKCKVAQLSQASPTDKQSLPDDLNKLVKWSNGNMDEEYKMGDNVLGRTTQEKDLGVTFSGDVKVSVSFQSFNVGLLLRQEIKF